MQVLGIATAPDIEASVVIDPLTDRLSERGSVGVIKQGGDEFDVPDRTTYTITDTGWTGSGSNLDVRTALDRLAVSQDYALVVGFPDQNLPHLTVGEVTASNTIESVSTPDAVDHDELLRAIEETDPFESLESLIAEVNASPEEEYAGAIATFTGRVRAKEHEDDDITTALEFEKYDEVAEERMATIQSELADRDGVKAVALHHRTGHIELGENIVFVVVLAGHRAEAFETVADGINRIKAEVPLFKKEVTVEEEFWVHEQQ